VTAQSTLGGKLGPRIVQLVVDGMAAHLQQSGPHRARVHAAGLNEFHRQMGDELRPLLGPMFAELARQLPPDHPLRPLLAFLAVQPGEAAVLLGLGASTIGVGTSIGTVFNNLLAPATESLIAASPRLPLAAGIAAQAEVFGLGFLDSNSREAARSGINGDRFKTMVEIAYNRLSVAEIQEAQRRGAIPPGDLDRVLQLAGSDTYSSVIRAGLAANLLTPADAALAVLRGAISQDEGERIAKLNGLDAHDFGVLVLNTGEPPGLQELQEALRRGFIDTGRFDRGVKQSRVRDEWIDVVTELRYSPMDTSDAVRAVVQNYLTRDEAATIADHNGLAPGMIDVLLKVEGNPLSPGELFELWNRNVIDQGTVEQGLRESHLKDKYIPAALHLRERLPEGRQVVTMLERGGLTVEQAHTILAELGYQPMIANAIIKTGTSSRTSAHRALTEAMVVALYEAEAVTAQDAARMLEALGYSATEVAFILRLADLRAEHTYQQSAITHLRAAVVARHLTVQDASSQLDQLGVTAGQRDRLLHLWEIEQSATVHRLTAAQILRANKLGVKDDTWTLDRLTGMGYDPQDAELLITIEGSGGAAATPSQPRR